MRVFFLLVARKRLQADLLFIVNVLFQSNVHVLLSSKCVAIYALVYKKKSSIHAASCLHCLQWFAVSGIQLFIFQ